MTNARFLFARPVSLGLLLALTACGLCAAAPTSDPIRPAPKPAAPAAKPGAAAKPTPAKPGTAPKPAITAATHVTPATLAATLKALGYTPTAQGQYLRLKVDEAKYTYLIDLVTSKSGDWLVCMTHLKPIPDLTKVPSAALLSLLSTNDSLLGMYFSYNRAEGSVMLNATVPMRALDAGSLQNLIEGIRNTVRQTEGLWDAAKW